MPTITFDLADEDAIRIALALAGPTGNNPVEDIVNVTTQYWSQAVHNAELTEAVAAAKDSITPLDLSAVAAASIAVAAGDLGDTGGGAEPAGMGG